MARAEASLELFGDASIVGGADTRRHVVGDVRVVSRCFSDVDVVADVVAKQIVAEMLVKKPENLERVARTEFQPAREDAGAVERGIQRVAGLFDGLKERHERLDAERCRLNRNEKVIGRGERVQREDSERSRCVHEDVVPPLGRETLHCLTEKGVSCGALRRLRFELRQEKAARYQVEAYR